MIDDKDKDSNPRKSASETEIGRIEVSAYHDFVVQAVCSTYKYHLEPTLMPKHNVGVPRPLFLSTSQFYQMSTVYSRRHWQLCTR